MKTRIYNYKKSVLLLLLLVVLFLVSYIAVNAYVSIYDIQLEFVINYKSNTEDIFQVFYSEKSTEDVFSESMSLTAPINSSQYFEEASFGLPIGTNKIRVDLGSKASYIDIQSIEVKRKFVKKVIGAQDILNASDFNNYISDKQVADDVLHINTLEGDPFLVLKSDISSYADELEKQYSIYKVIYSALSSIIIYLLFFFIVYSFRIKLLKNIKVFIKDILGARELIYKLAVNDFKTKYAGSYFGIIWAFVQPIITIFTFWFVFEVGFRSAPVQDYPFILWFICGIIPWFFFSEATMNAMNSLIEYNYLVKKIVFKISILPLIKVISSLFVHIFFCFFIFIAFTFSGYKPVIYNIQILYYLLCLFTLVVSISFITSSIVIFFKDFTQIISIVLQVGMWFTPIMWSYKIIPQKYDIIFRINPMFYITEGYRDCFINKVWFFEKPWLTLTFWIITIVMFLTGTYLFKRLKPHFSDVL